MFDPSNYPRTYTATSGRKLLFTAVALAGNLLVAWQFAIFHASPPWWPLVSTALAVLSAAWVTHQIAESLVVYPDRLEVRSLMSRRIVRRCDLAAFVASWPHEDGRIVVWLRLSNGKVTKIQTLGPADEAFIAWLDHVLPGAMAPPPEPDTDQAPYQSGSRAALGHFDASAYPRLYQKPRGVRFGASVPAVVTGLVLAVFAMSFIVLTPGSQLLQHMRHPLAWLTVLMPAGFAVREFIAAWADWRTRLVLHADRLELVERVRRIVRRDQIAVCRHYVSDDDAVRYIKLYLRDHRQVVVSSFVAADAAFDVWFREIPIVVNTVDLDSDCDD
ncbi:hypothetical protein ABI_09180 [Asticcacaulis biprosthecium C19]|uniref:Uncharacterized protein n=1 Tax=Asticcacaulis biprosthecium C19 TaxID=715226 RepID=F4QGM9_9CAUL|nr:hypothetical protein [Asticcacaulis biprosthecium]EGF92481.1 hypothetical protein ABI_09180 [Asticcacaulis biprosthecium C19]